MLFPETIETERLTLEPLCHETVDVFDFYQCCSTHEQGIDEVTRYLPWNPHETVAESKAHIDELERQWEQGNRAQYVIRPKTGEDGAGTIAGAGGLRLDWETQTAKPCIWLRKPFWGRGYSGERAAAVIELAFDQLDLELVAVTIQDGNERSRNAAESYVDSYDGQYDGIIRNSDVRPDGEIIDHHRYTITREQYRQSDGGDRDETAETLSYEQATGRSND
ncbi:GNAT family N-acetyltransferase [Natronorubrum daqingense]|uniref:GNAT family N-acetyltransferase n=1 Tax=Natronorubrum daqingense TaxID=588898 RepID=A0A1N7A4F7_9EURY|nr:GNAT family protein [Natronorubrum daqingense]APX95145.1 GNAT family N-acetyltransferase [Natronorubrum daqingense]SIR33967.1 Protein N-acetyltransferase, RimJ/RimL family [Natronorubrum daqingense]